MTIQVIPVNNMFCAIPPTVAKSPAVPFQPHLRPILRAMDSSAVTLGFICQHARSFAVPRGRWVLIGCDDPDPGVPALGPAAFDMLLPKLKRATAIFVHSGEPDPVAYADAADMATNGGRVILIETRFEQHAAWSRMVRKAAPNARHVDVIPVAGHA